MSEWTIGIIGGSGLYSMDALEDSQWIAVETPWGAPSDELLIGRIEGVYVARDFRRRGIGRMMMGRALEICARSLFKHVFLSVDPGNAPALALYRQMGFAKIGNLVTYRAPGVTPQSS